jgi:seryl-tRNA synthetase
VLDRQRLRENPEEVRRGLERKGVFAPLEKWLRCDAEWRELLAEVEQARAEMNRQSKSIGNLLSQGKKEEAERAREEAKRLKEVISAHEDRLKEVERELHRLELLMPNLPHESVPDGKGPEDNVVVEEVGEKRAFSFPPKPHWEIAENLGLIDFEAGSKISGSGFMVFRGKGARLQRALITLMLNLHTEKHGYQEVYPPYLVTRETMTGTGQLPKFEEEMYWIERDDLFLIPTAEVPVTNLHRDEILSAEDLPLRYVALSACFRREAGAAGQMTRGLLRVHQFDKVELVKFCEPETSYGELETLRKDASAVLDLLGLPYRVTLLCAGELGFANAKCYDLEVWAPGVEKYLEVSSCSNFEDFQARRANIRYRPQKGAKPRYVHTLNASGVALPRLMAALLETYQEEDGSVSLPEVLHPLMGCERLERS